MNNINTKNTQKLSKNPIFFDKNFDFYKGLADPTVGYKVRENLRRLVNRFFISDMSGNEKLVFDVIFERT